jgi:hypothetical protein
MFTSQFFRLPIPAPAMDRKGSRFAGCRRFLEIGRRIVAVGPEPAFVHAAQFAGTRTLE